MLPVLFLAPAFASDGAAPMVASHSKEAAHRYLIERTLKLRANLQ